MLMIRSIEHVAILAADPLILTQWYCDTLDFKILTAKDAKGQYFINLPEGGVLEILPANDKERPHQELDDVGIRHIAFTVDDYEAAANSLEDKGVTFLSPHPEVTGRHRINFFHDPEGNILQLVWRPKPLG